MTKIQDVHPVLCHSMDVAVKILENAIKFREREIADMQAAIIACQTVRSEEALPRQETQPEDLEPSAKELADPARTRRLAQFRTAAREGTAAPNGAAG